MRATIKKIVLYGLCGLIVLSSISACQNTQQENPYEGKECIKCGAQATTSSVGTLSMCATLNRDYTTKNYKKNEANNIYTIYFCDRCYDSIPGPTKSYTNL